MKRIFTAASLFCGAGGLDIGFDREGFHTVWATDWNKDACETFRLWSDAEVVCGDITKISTDDIPDIDIILGGFPCPGYSLAGPRRLDDPRNRLYLEYVRILKAKMPLAFVGENVKGLLTMGEGKVIKTIIDEFSSCGYDVKFKLVNAKNYEVPEDRERVIIVGFRKDLNITDFDFPRERDFFISLKDALADVSSPAPEDICDAPYSSRYMSRNRKRRWDEVSFTIPAMAKQVPLYPGSPDMVKLAKDIWRFGEGETRRLSWKEAAAIQTFPDNMQFCGNLTSKYMQIGNAVPCKLAELIAKEVYQSLSSATSSSLF